MVQALRLQLLFILLVAAFAVYAGESYDFFFVSDLHLGPATTFNTEPETKFRFKGDIHRADNALPDYENMFQHLAEHADDGTRFLIQCGDMVEGNAKNETEHRKQLNFALGLLKKHVRFPVYHVLGNHDALGNGGMEAFKATILPEITMSIGQDAMADANYTVTVGDDLFVFTGYYEASKGWPFLKGTLKTLEKRPRYLFLIVHSPFIHVAKSSMVDLLASYNAIVFSGHIHTGYTVTYQKDTNILRQVTVCSYLGANVDKMKGGIASRNLEDYRSYLAKFAMRQHKEALIEKFDTDWAPFLSNYAAFRSSGYLKVYVSDDGIRLEYQSANIKNEADTIELINKKKILD